MKDGEMVFQVLGKADPNVINKIRGQKAHAVDRGPDDDRQLEAADPDEMGEAQHGPQ